MPLMAASSAVSRHPVRVFEAVVAEVRDLSPHFRRITLTGPALEEFGVPGPTLDLRIKMLLPNPGCPPILPGTARGVLDAGWYQDWLKQDQPGRGHIRSYTVRSLRKLSGGAELDIDFVLHDCLESRPGPGSAWARNAAPGRPAWLVGPDATAITAATRLPEAGINWNPGSSTHVLLAGDETAVPAVSAILESLPPSITGHAFLEVPDAADTFPLAAPDGVHVTWLDRGTVARGLLLEREIVASAGRSAAEPGYAWVGAEAGMVRKLRRCLAGLGFDSRTSEFRGYWSLGKAGSAVNGVPMPTAHGPRPVPPPRR